MNLLRASFAGPLLIALINVLSLDAQAQQKTLLPPALNENSSLTELLDWLNKNAFPHARIGLKGKAAHGPKPRFGGVRSYYAGGERFFSEGFHIKFVDGCQVVLSNEQVTMVDARNPDSGAFYKFVTQKKGTRPLTPQVAMVYVSLYRMSDKRGRKPHLLSDDRKNGKSAGWWQTNYEQRGFFTKLIFDAELTSVEQPQTKELGHFDYLTFNFESRELAEHFNTAFRHAIKICTRK